VPRTAIVVAAIVLLAGIAAMVMAATSLRRWRGGRDSLRLR
jgi:hypothetical protein